MIFINKYFIDDEEILDFAGEIDSAGVALFIDVLDTFGIKFDIEDYGTTIEINISNYRYKLTGNNLDIIREILKEYLED